MSIDLEAVLDLLPAPPVHIAIALRNNVLTTARPFRIVETNEADLIACEVSSANGQPIAIYVGKNARAQVEEFIKHFETLDGIRDNNLEKNGE